MRPPKLGANQTFVRVKKHSNASAHNSYNNYSLFSIEDIARNIFFSSIFQILQVSLSHYTNCRYRPISLVYPSGSVHTTMLYQWPTGGSSRGWGRLIELPTRRLWLFSVTMLLTPSRAGGRLTPTATAVRTRASDVIGNLYDVIAHPSVPPCDILTNRPCTAERFKQTLKITIMYSVIFLRLHRRTRTCR